MGEGPTWGDPLTPWVRLYLVVEGQTEREFALNTLSPHLAGYCIEVKPKIVITNRRLGKRGGILNFEQIKGDLGRLMKEDQGSEARFSTMIDFYALPTSFPGWSTMDKKISTIDRVKKLEAALGMAFNDSRFLPFIQLHEFESLLFCDLQQLQSRISDSVVGVRNLLSEVEGLPPEEINEGEETAPSKRIIRHVPTYRHSKVRVGASAACAIGLPTLREKCPHFHEWVTKLELLGRTVG